MLERFTNKIEKLVNGCHQWEGCTTAAGYGRFRNEFGITVQAHRYAYICAKGAIPRGMVLDHLCRNRACVNPDHLEAVSISENVRRGESHNRNKRLCIRGHALILENVYINPTSGARQCKICARDWICAQNPDVGVANKHKTHCINGHAYTNDNTVYNNKGWRSCRQCRRNAQRKYIEKKSCL